MATNCHHIDCSRSGRVARDAQPRLTARRLVAAYCLEARNVAEQALADERAGVSSVNRLKAFLEAGDAAGHEFHGNQWTRWRKINNDRHDVELFHKGESVGHVNVLTDIPGVAQTEDLEVWRGHRGKGYAVALYKKLVADAKAKGFTSVESSANLTEGGEAVWLRLKRDGMPVEKLKDGRYKISIKPGEVKASNFVQSRSTTAKDLNLSVKAIIRDIKGRVLLLDDAGSGFWDLPGGHVKAGEKPEQALRREVKEETGLEIQVGRQLGGDVLDLGGTRTPVLFYEASMVGGGRVEAAEWREELHPRDKGRFTGKLGSGRHQTDSPEFKAWFGDSKVVDADGNPMVVYHGTASDIKSFDSEQGGKVYFGEKLTGHYFTESPVGAAKYAKFASAEYAKPTAGENILPVYLSLQNPKVITVGKDEASSVSPKHATLAKTEGYDGLIIQGSGEAGTGFDKPRIFVAFKPEQIKSKFNKGAWSKTDKNIAAEETRFPGGCFVNASATPSITISSEHVGYRWFALKDALKVNAGAFGPLLKRVLDSNDEAIKPHDRRRARMQKIYDAAIHAALDRAKRETLVNLGRGMINAAEWREELHPRDKGKFAEKSGADSPEFKAWFGDSKVVDADGKPLVVYHGTGEAFESFQAGKAGAFYFAADPKDASDYADIHSRYSGSANVIPAYLKLENDGWKRFNAPEIHRLIFEAGGTAKVHAKLKAEGFDGYHEPEGMYVVFAPTQIKSAIGNKGTWSKTDPNISACGAFVNAASTFNFDSFLFDPDDFAADFLAELRKAGEKAWKVSMRALALKPGQKLTPTGVVEDFLIKRENKLKDVPQEIYDDIKEKLEEAASEGGSEADMADAVREAFDQVYEGRAETVARTETGSVYGAVNDEAIRQAGYTGKKWVSASDDFVRPSHQDLNGTVIPVDDVFDNGCKFPCDPDGEVGEVINCRCVCVAVDLDEEGVTEARGANGHTAVNASAWDESAHPRNPAGSEGGGKFASSDLPERTADSMSDAIALGSPSGSMSKRGREAALERLRVALFGQKGLQQKGPVQPTEIEYARRQSKELRGLAERGMKPRAYRKKADELDMLADELESKELKTA